MVRFHIRQHRLPQYQNVWSYDVETQLFPDGNGEIQIQRKSVAITALLRPCALRDLKQSSSNQNSEAFSHKATIFVALHNKSKDPKNGKYFDATHMRRAQEILGRSLQLAAQHHCCYHHLELSKQFLFAIGCKIFPVHVPQLLSTSSQISLKCFSLSIVSII